MGLVSLLSGGFLDFFSTDPGNGWGSRPSVGEFPPSGVREVPPCTCHLGECYLPGLGTEVYLVPLGCPSFTSTFILLLRRRKHQVVMRGSGFPYFCLPQLQESHLQVLMEESASAVQKRDTVPFPISSSQICLSSLWSLIIFLSLRFD